VGLNSTCRYLIKQHVNDESNSKKQMYAQDKTATLGATSPSSYLAPLVPTNQLKEFEHSTVLDKLSALSPIIRRSRREFILLLQNLKLFL